MSQQTEEKEELNVEPKARWTKDQQAVIDARDKSLLVSAAAGSGKTAVLVERILSLITDPVHPIDVDEILVVTFTNAAADEMRERIRSALAVAARQHTEDDHLQRQMALIHNAQIMTIDSFCLQVIRNHFHVISLEPGFRIADEGELLLLREEVCDAVLEDFYAERDPSFLCLIEGYCTAKSEKNVRDIILDLYNYAQSYPWPEEWLDGCVKEYEADSVEELESKDWMQSYFSYLRTCAEELVFLCRENIALAQEEGGPDVYLEMLEDDLEHIEILPACDSLSSLRNAIAEITFPRLQPASKSKFCEEKIKAIQVNRKKISKRIKELANDLAVDEEVQLDLMNKTGEIVRVIIRLVKAFSARFAQEKAKRNILDFSDEEHFALQILEDPETKEPNETAREYRQKFREVMVDEYQDSNYLQEEILTAVSGIPEGRQNMFMVGDVKQSIYRFRQGRPDLFLGKYETFSKEDTPRQRIDLHKNFRSRAEILNMVNDLFGRIMGRDLGNIEYDEDAALYKGREYKDTENTDYRPECILVEPDPDNKDAAFTEASVIARRIRRMIEGQEMPDIHYRDVVILLRSTRGSAQPYLSAFEQEGVPLLVASETGYFSAPEVQVVLSMLRVIDNPRQDIPLATVMRSPIGGFTDEEMAGIRAGDPELPFYECVLCVSEDDKVERFRQFLESFRARVPYTPIHRLILQIYEETGYRDYAAALPAGKQRRANLDMLVKKAVTYENTSYHGLYHFVRYIDSLIKYETDEGEADVVSEQDDAVRLMTIHKSKGLEFPVVFVSGMNKQINLQDSQGKMIFHPDFGVGLRYCDPEKRTTSETLIHHAFSAEAKRESLGEELRVLYVAMTRAKDKLILTGMAPNKETGDQPAASQYEKTDFSLRFNAITYWDWVLPALATYGDAYPLQHAGRPEEAVDDAQHLVRVAQRRSALLAELASTDPEMLTELSERFSWQYPWPQSGMKQKMSVSEIKHRAMNDAREILEEDDAQELFPDEIPRPYIPKFVKEPEENSGALRGTAFHRLMESLDIAHLSEDAAPWLEDEIARLCSAGRLSCEDAERIDRVRAVRFLESDLAARMAESARRGRLVREQPFVMSVPAVLVLADADPEESVLIQGIIDAFWEEDDGIILLDYKTDRVEKPEELIARYRAQLMLYAEALGRRFADHRVKEILIYSFCLDETIPVPFLEET